MNARPLPVLRFIVLGLLFVVLPLAVGIALAPRMVPAPKVGIIRLWTDIHYWTAQEVIEQLAYARAGPLDQGGGDHRR